MKIVVIVRDMGAGAVAQMIVREMRDRRHDVLFLAEADGQACKTLKEPFALVNDEAELTGMIEGYKPDVIVTGLSSPRHLEAVADRIALEGDVELVQLEDYWGCYTRAQIPADLYITIDDNSARLVNRAHPKAAIAVAGFAGITLMPTPRQSLIEAMDDLRKDTGAKVIVFPDGGDQCEPGLRLLIDSIRLTKTPIILVPKFHPKFKTLAMPGSEKTWGEHWEEILASLRTEGRVRDFAEPTPEVLMAADAIASGYSTMLVQGATYGKTPITLWTSETAVALKAETGLDQTPLMMYGGRFPIIQEPQPLDDILSSSVPELDISSFDPDIAADAIGSLI